MVGNVIQIVTEKLSSLPFIEGIVLGGSRARGTHTENSDKISESITNQNHLTLQRLIKLLQNWMIKIETTLLCLPERGVIGLMAADGCYKWVSC